MKPMDTSRIGITAFALVVFACGLVTAIMLVQLVSHDHDRERADARTSGRVIQDGIGHDGDIRVRWTDGSGQTHVNRFRIHDTDAYVKGAEFPVRYDRGDPGRTAFPADDAETAVRDDLFAGMILPWVLVLLVGTWWAVRLLRARRTRRGDKHDAVATVFCAHHEYAGPLSPLVRTTWVRIASSPHDGLQRVMWHPSLSSVRHEEPVTVTRGSGGATIVLADGARLTPIGRLRDRAPAHYRLDDLVTVRCSRADTIVRRHGSAHDPWLRTIVLRAAYGAVFGATAGALLTSVTLIWVGAILGAATAVNLWVLHGADR